MRRKRQSFSEWAASRYDVPADVFPGGFRVELRDRNTMFLSGCKRILKYSATCMEFETGKDERIMVEGERLVCASYLAEEVLLDGWIRSVTISGREPNV